MSLYGGFTSGLKAAEQAYKTAGTGAEAAKAATRKIDPETLRMMSRAATPGIALTGIGAGSYVALSGAGAGLRSLATETKEGSKQTAIGIALLAGVVILGAWAYTKVR